MIDITQWPHNGLLPPAKPIVYTVAELFATAKAALILQIDATYRSLLYTNTTALFPSGSKVIQLRDESELRTFERVTLAAITRQSAKREEAKVKFRTEDNVTQELPASEFIPIALDILDAKQALWDVRTAHKDAALKLETIEAVTAYDINSGWPITNEPLWVIQKRSSEIYKGMVRRRAETLVNNGDGVGAIILLKTIEE